MAPFEFRVIYKHVFILVLSGGLMWERQREEMAVGGLCGGEGHVRFGWWRCGGIPCVVPVCALMG